MKNFKVLIFTMLITCSFQSSLLSMKTSTPSSPEEMINSYQKGFPSLHQYNSPRNRSYWRVEECHLATLGTKINHCMDSTKKPTLPSPLSTSPNFINSLSSGDVKMRKQTDELAQEFSDGLAKESYGLVPNIRLAISSGLFGSQVVSDYRSQGFSESEIQKKLLDFTEKKNIAIAKEKAMTEELIKKHSDMALQAASIMRAKGVSESAIQYALDDYTNEQNEKIKHVKETLKTLAIRNTAESFMRSAGMPKTDII